MTKIYKYIILIAIFLLSIAAAWFLGYKESFVQKRVEVSSETILQEVRNVVKLATVEGYFSEVFDYKEHFGFNISPFRKKALIRTKAKVLVGFDMKDVKIDISEETKEIIISNISSPNILSIDHDLDYYDITEGTFNSFTTVDYNKMNRQSKMLIEQTALKSDLFKRAKTQLKQHFQLLNSLLSNYGWQLKTEYKEELTPLN